MQTSAIDNIHINQERSLLSPRKLKDRISLPDEQAQFIAEARQTISRILSGEDPRLMVIVGPCSIHDPRAALEYAERLANLAKKVKDTLFIVMRVYFEKPRTTVGWKGLVNDPYLNGSFKVEEGLVIARQLLRSITALGMPIATEALDPITPQYLHDFVAWTAIGARTTESQTHREMASGLSSPVGFKNGTDGSFTVAINAMQAASQPHSFLGINNEGNIAILDTTGNDAAHIVLRGGKEPNYDSVSVAECEAEIEKAGFKPSIVIDCSHGNSHKNHKRQPLVFENVISQILEGNTSIRGLMVESNLEEGNQPLSTPDHLHYGVSITDKCIDWHTTDTLIQSTYQKLKYVLRPSETALSESAIA